MNKHFFLTILFVIANITFTNENEWVTSDPEKIPVTVFFQGMFCSQTKCALYTGKRGFISTTSQHVSCPHAIDVILDPFLEPELDDVEFKDGNQDSQSLIKKIIRWNNNRICSTYPIHVESNKSSNQKESVEEYTIEVSKLNFGQARDIECHKKKMDACDIKHPERPKILWGTSRGAAATLTAVAIHGDRYRNVKLAIFEGCFDTVENVINNRFYHFLLEKISEYKRDGISPIKAAKDVPKDIPAVFITSKKDELVPHTLTHNVAYTLAQTRSSDDAPVYLLTLERSSHPYYMIDDSEDRSAYESFIHALYKKYDLPHIPEYAEQGKNLVEACKLN